CAPGNDEDPIVSRNELLDEALVEKLETAGVQTIKVRSPITCEARFGVCASCYGRDLARGHLVNIGEGVGVIGAQSRPPLCATAARRAAGLRRSRWASRARS